MVNRALLYTCVTGHLALHMYGADWALLYTYDFFILMFGVTCSLALHVYGDDWALLYTYDFFIVMIGVTSHLAQ